jgi:hypothetical protein
MQESRRSLVRGAIATAATLIAAISVSTQNPFPKPQSPVRPDDEPIDGNPLAKSPKKILLEENQKDIKKNIEKLFDLASQLKEQVEKTDATTVLSLAMVKKAEEIERLAHQIKEKAKG